MDSVLECSVFEPPLYLKYDLQKVWILNGQISDLRCGNLETGINYNWNLNSEYLTGPLFRSTLMSFSQLPELLQLDR